MVILTWEPSFSMKTKITVKVTNASRKETMEFIPQQDLNDPKHSILNIFSSVAELDALYSFHECSKMKELFQIIMRAMLSHSRPKWVKSQP